MPRRANHKKNRNKGKLPTEFQLALKTLPPGSAILHNKGMFRGVTVLGKRKGIRGEVCATASEAATSLLKALFVHIHQKNVAAEKEAAEKKEKEQPTGLLLPVHLQKDQP